MSNGSANIDGNKVFDEYYADVKASGGSSGQELKFNEERGIYLSKRWSASGLMARLTRNRERLQERRRKREACRDEIKASLTRQFGDKVSNKIFQRLGLDSSKELTVNQLDWVHREVQRVKSCLAETHATESVQFLASVNLLDRIKPDAQTQDYRNALKLILDEYVLVGSPLEINIDYRQRAYLTEARKKVDTMSAEELNAVRGKLSMAVNAIRILSGQVADRGSGQYWSQENAHIETLMENEGILDEPLGRDVDGIFDHPSLQHLRRIVAHAATPASDCGAGTIIKSADPPVPQKPTNERSCSDFVNDCREDYKTIMASTEECTKTLGELRKHLSKNREYTSSWRGQTQTAVRLADRSLSLTRSLKHFHRAISPRRLAAIVDGADRAITSLEAAKKSGLDAALADGQIKMLKDHRGKVQALYDTVRATSFTDVSGEDDLERALSAYADLKKGYDTLSEQAMKELESLKELCAVDGELRPQFIAARASYGALKKAMAALLIPPTGSVSARLELIDDAFRAAVELRADLLHTARYQAAARVHAKAFRASVKALNLSNELRELHDFVVAVPINHSLHRAHEIAVQESDLRSQVDESLAYFRDRRPDPERYDAFSILRSNAFQCATRMEKLERSPPPQNEQERNRILDQESMRLVGRSLQQLKPTDLNMLLKHYRSKDLKKLSDGLRDRPDFGPINDAVSDEINDRHHRNIAAFDKAAREFVAEPPDPATEPGRFVGAVHQLWQLADALKIHADCFKYAEIDLTEGVRQVITDKLKTSPPPFKELRNQQLHELRQGWELFTTSTNKSARAREALEEEIKARQAAVEKDYQEALSTTLTAVGSSNYTELLKGLIGMSKAGSRAIEVHNQFSKKKIDAVDADATTEYRDRLLRKSLDKLLRESLDKLLRDGLGKLLPDDLDKESEVKPKLLEILNNLLSAKPMITFAASLADVADARYDYDYSSKYPMPDDFAPGLMGVIKEFKLLRMALEERAPKEKNDSESSKPEFERYEALSALDPSQRDAYLALGLTFTGDGKVCFDHVRHDFVLDGFQETMLKHLQKNSNNDSRLPHNPVLDDSHTVDYVSEEFHNLGYQDVVLKKPDSGEQTLYLHNVHGKARLAEYEKLLDFCDGNEKLCKFISQYAVKATWSGALAAITSGKSPLESKLPLPPTSDDSRDSYTFSLEKTQEGDFYLNTTWIYSVDEISDLGGGDVEETDSRCANRLKLKARIILPKSANPEEIQLDGPVEYEATIVPKQVVPNQVTA